MTGARPEDQPPGPTESETNTEPELNPDEEPNPEAEKLRAEIRTLLRCAGLIQTGHPVDLAWVSRAAATIAAEVLGVCDEGWVLEFEDWPPALLAIRDRAASQIKSDRQAAWAWVDNPF